MPTGCDDGRVRGKAGSCRSSSPCERPYPTQLAQLHFVRRQSRVRSGTPATRTSTRTSDPIAASGSPASGRSRSTATTHIRFHRHYNGDAHVTMPTRSPGASSQHEQYIWHCYLVGRPLRGEQSALPNCRNSSCHPGVRDTPGRPGMAYRAGRRPGLSAISALRVRRPFYGITRVPLLERLQLCCLSVDDFEHDISRLQLSVRQELRIAEYRALDGLAADRFGHRLAIQRFGRLDGAGPDL